MIVLSHGQSIKSLRAVGLCGGTFSLKSAVRTRLAGIVSPLFYSRIFFYSNFSVAIEVMFKPT